MASVHPSPLRRRSPSSSSAMKRQSCLIIVLVIFTIQVTMAHVMPKNNSPPTTTTPRETRVMAPLAGVLSWFGGGAVATRAESLFGSSVNQYFSGALASSVISQRIVNTLRSRDYRPYNTLLASSLCSDEINETPDSLITRLEQKLGNVKSGGVFHLGGLAGLPFVGTTGMGACLGHLPQDGKLVIVYGPHVGISESGQVGKVERLGRTDETDSCGAATAAYRAIVSAKKLGGGGGLDLEQDYLVDKLKAKLGALAQQEAEGGSKAISLVTLKVYELINDMVRKELEPFLTNSPTVWSKVKEITLLGGVIVNRSPMGGEDYFQPLTLKSINSDGEVNLYDSAFGDLSTPRTYT